MRTLRRAHLSFAVIAFVFGTTAVLVAAIGSRADAQTATDNTLVDRGHALFETGCVSCHGENGRGVVTPDGEILMPGEVEERTKAQRLRDGIDIDATTWSQVVDTARGLGLGEEHWAAV